MRIDRPALATDTPAAATISTKIPSSRSFVPTPLASPEKNNVRRMTAPKSATVPPAITSWPNSVELCPASFNTGTTSPSDVATSVMPMSSGDRTWPDA